MTEHKNVSVFLLGATALIIGISWTVLFFENEIGLNIPLFAALITVGGLYLANVFSKKLVREHYILLGLILFFTSMVFVRSSDLVTVLNVFGSALLFLLLAGSIAGRHVARFKPFDYLKTPLNIFYFIRPFFETLAEIFTLGTLSDHPRAKEIVRGSLMAAVAVVVFTLLFASADAFFEKLLTDAIAWKLDEAFFARIIATLVVTALFIGAFSFAFRTTHAESESKPLFKRRELGVLETSILLGSLNALFLVFIALQLAYLFGGESHIVSAGLTYAEYARQGFFELVVVALLSYFVIAFTESMVVKKEEAHIPSYKILSGILVLQVIIILASAFNRLSLYEEAYGFTDARLFGYAFMIWLGIVLALLSYHISTNGKNTTFALRAFATIIVFLFGLNALNPDVFIAQKNLERYAETGKIDALYLGSLSYDALPYTIHLLDDQNEEVSKNFAHGLYENYYRCLEGCEGKIIGEPEWQSLRWNRARGEALLEPKRDFILANKEKLITEAPVTEVE